MEDAEGAEVSKPTTGMKFDAGKPRWSLLPLVEVEKIVRVLTFGAAKYADSNWQLVDPSKYHDALFRHITAWQAGEKADAETGISHLAHAGACVLFLLWHEANAK